MTCIAGPEGSTAIGRSGMDIPPLKTCCTARPFRPFTVNLSDGRSFRVAHPDFLIVSPDRATVIVFHESGGFDILAPDQITGIGVGETGRRRRAQPTGR